MLQIQRAADAVEVNTPVKTISSAAVTEQSQTEYVSGGIKV